MKNLNLYRVVRIGGNPISVLVFAYAKNDAERYSDKKYGKPLMSRTKKIPVESGLVLSEISHR